MTVEQLNVRFVTLPQSARAHVHGERTCAPCVHDQREARILIALGLLGMFAGAGVLLALLVVVLLA